MVQAAILSRKKTMPLASTGMVKKKWSSSVSVEVSLNLAGTQTYATVNIYILGKQLFAFLQLQ